MSGMVVKERRGPEAFASLRSAWRSLYERSNAAPFLSWEWLDAWLRHLGEGRTPLLLCAWRGCSLEAILPLCEERAAGGRRLSFLGERWGGADFLDLIAPEGSREEAGRAIATYLARRCRFDLLELDGLPEGSSTIGWIATELLQRGGLHLRLAPRFVCPEIAGSWEEVLRRCRRGENFRRRLRQLERTRGFERRVVRAPEEAAAAFDRFLALHDARWASQGGSDAMGRPALRSFQREVAVRLAEAGRLRFEEIWAEGGCRASIYAIDTPGRRYFYQSGFNPAWSKRSVGLVCLGLSIRDALEEGPGRYDFLRGTEAYKFDWATGVRRTVSLRAVAAGIPSAVWLAREGAEAAARAAAHALLPAAAVERLRRWRRALERGVAGGGALR